MIHLKQKNGMWLWRAIFATGQFFGIAETREEAINAALAARRAQ